MIQGIARWYFDEAADLDVPSYLMRLDNHRLHLRNPGDHRVWVLDEVGSRRESSDAFVRDEWSMPRALNFQLWIDANTDVFVTVAPGGRLATFYLDGLLQGEAERVVASLAYCAYVSPETSAFVLGQWEPEGIDECADE